MTEKVQMKVTIFRNGDELATFEAPWGAQMAATVPDHLDQMEIRIERVERVVPDLPAIAPPDDKKARTKLAEKLDAAAKG